MSLQLKTKPNIIKFQAMPNDEHWQGNIVALADDGKIYISEHNENGSRWVVYVEDEFEET